LPAIVVLYVFIVLEYAPDAVTVAFNADLPCMYAPNFVASPAVASATVKAEILGTTEEGTLAVKETVLVPISVLPLYVLHVMVHVPDVAFGIWLANDIGTVHALDVPRSLPIVPVALPNLYVNV
jgi:hypothetical protein